MGPCSNDGVSASRRSPDAPSVDAQPAQDHADEVHDTMAPTPIATITSHSVPEIDAVSKATFMNGA